MLRRDEIQIRDPFVLPIIEEHKYYLYGTTDKNAWTGNATGFDCYTSYDLQNWEGPFPVFRPTVDFWADMNYWAPEVHFYQDKYYMFATFKSETKCRGTQILVSDKPLGPFIIHSETPVTPLNWECLDGTFYVDKDGIPYIVYCHEWIQVQDGEMYAQKLSNDLKSTLEEPVLLFRASDAPWSRPYTGCVPSDGVNCYVTDGPYMIKAKSGSLLMLWSSFTDDGYAIGIARSETGRINGPWQQENTPFFEKDGGHGMVFKTFEGKTFLSIHTPNDTPNERPIFIELEDAFE